MGPGPADGRPGPPCHGVPVRSEDEGGSTGIREQSARSTGLLASTVQRRWTKDEMEVGRLARDLLAHTAAAREPVR